MTSNSEIYRICRATGFDYPTLLNRTRSEKIVFARYVVMNYLSDTILSEEQIAETFKLHRTMTNYAKKQINDVLSTQTPKWAVDMIKNFKAKIDRKNEQENDFCPFIELDII